MSEEIIEEFETIRKPYLKAEISDITNTGLTISTEFNCNSRREAAAMVASLAAEICENRADFNMLMTLCRKQLNYEKRQDMAARKGNNE